MNGFINIASDQQLRQTQAHGTCEITLSKEYIRTCEITFNREYIIVVLCSCVPLFLRTRRH